ncbi:MAG: SDR family oxidoreductase [Desulfobulbus sp.]|jgi:3-hydroxy acid dehydrogenase/malonic semialdehyde reductase|nr:SDR family oxidoreductase [Desulfobulbaceae bacterium]
MSQQTILITGATAGFGWACAERFAKEGWKLIIAGRRQERLDNLAKQLAPAPTHSVVLDVRDAASIKAMLAALPEEFAAIDVLLNNAGLALGMAGAQNASLDDWNTMIDTNIRGLCTLTRLVLPGMIARNKGHIVNLGSIAGTFPYPGGNVYGASKAFVKQFSRNLQADLVHTPLRVTNIEPGLAESEFSIVRFHGDTSKADAVYQGTEPLHPADIAEIVYWVCSAPPHVNICSVEVMPTCQSCGPLFVHRQSTKG